MECFILTNLKYSMLHSDILLKLINMSALHQNTTFRSKRNIFSHYPHPLFQEQAGLKNVG